MAESFKIVISNPISILRGNVLQLSDRLNRAIETTANMIASMWLAAGQADIASAGFGPSWTQGLHTTISGAAPNMMISMTHDNPNADIFQTGGTIQGSPLLWIPLSGTNAVGVRASAFSDGLTGGRAGQTFKRPLLFSLADRQPKYFGIESVTIPQKFDLNADAMSVMANYRQIFEDAWERA